MAAYTEKTEQFLQRVTHTQTWWTSTYDPSDTVPVSGIYRCTVCGKEITSNKNDPFPHKTIINIVKNKMLNGS